MDILQNFLTTGFFYTIIRVSTPLIFASLSSLIARKGGVTNITIDSTMIMSALTGVLVSAYTKNIWLALVCGMAVGVVMGLHAAYEIFIGGTQVTWEIIWTYLPVSLLYISSMAMGYIGLRYIELYLEDPQCPEQGHIEPRQLPATSESFVQ